jgi:hypothetical protein
MYDLEIHLTDTVGSLSLMGTTLGNAGISVEGGGAWVVNGKGVAHFLFEDGPAARRALESAAIAVVSCRRVLRLRLQQETPGQLGLITHRMAQAGVKIEVLYSDHANHLILIVDDFEQGTAVVADWSNGQMAEARRRSL